MSGKHLTRRRFVGKTAAAASALTLSGPTILAPSAAEAGKPAILGGVPVRKAKFPEWPVIGEGDDAAWLEVFHAKGWYRGKAVAEFQKKFAALCGAKYCQAVNGGTTALWTSLVALGVGPGDEVLVPPFTFVATVNVVLLQYAIPVFVDTDRETFQMDHRKIEARITERTRAIIPVHLGGAPANMDAILAIAKKHNLAVIEDACQAHLAEWRGKKVGSLGDTGCFSFQVSKNLSSGDGGAILTNDDGVMERCFSFHTNGRERKNTPEFAAMHNGTNARMTEFQATLLLRGLTRIEQQMKTREQNAAYLSDQIKDVAGLRPTQTYEGVTRHAYHLYMMRYDPEGFGGLTRAQFAAALTAEGVPIRTGYGPLNKAPFIEQELRSRHFQRIYSREYVDNYFKNNECPENDRLCAGEALWFTQPMLLGSRADMDQIAAAIRKVQANAADIKKAGSALEKVKVIDV